MSLIGNLIQNQTGGGDGVGGGDPADPTANGSNSIVFREGAADTGPVVFGTWDGVKTRITDLRTAADGDITLDLVIDQEDNPFPARNTVTSGFDFTGITLVGLGAGTALAIADGVAVTNIRRLRNHLQLVNLNTTTPMEALPATFERIQLVNGCALLTPTGNAVMFDMTLSGGVQCKLSEQCIVGDTTGSMLGPIFSGAPAGKQLQLVSTDPNPSDVQFQPSVIFGAGFLIVSLDNTRAYPKDWPGWSGILPVGPFFKEQLALRPNPFQGAPSTSSVTIAFSDGVSLDATAGVITQALPDISAPPEFGYPGGMVAVVETSGINGIDLTVGAGDTINGVATFTIPAGGGVLLFGDGVDVWRVISLHDPTGSDNQTAAEVPFTPDGDIAATDTQAAVQEVRDDTDTKLTGKLGTAHEGAGGAVHADVVAAGASGFMTGADKTKLNGLGAESLYWTANDAIFPATTPAAATSRNGHALIAFDDTTAEAIVLEGVVPAGYAGAALEVQIHWVAETAIVDDVRWGASFERNNTDIDSDSFAAQQVTDDTTSGTSGIPTVTTIAFTQAQADGIVGGDSFRLEIERVAGATEDDMADDAQIMRIVLVEA